MKKAFFAAMAAVVLMFASCAKDQQFDTDNNTDGFALNVSFTTADSGMDITRAFFGNGTSETWEKTVNSVTAHVFNTDGDCVAYREFSPAEVTAAKASIGIPFAQPDERFTIYLVANRPSGICANEATLFAETETTPLSEYNGTAEEAISGQIPINGFVMSSRNSFTIPKNSSPLSLQVKLGRIVAKLAVKTVYDFESGSTLDGGDIRITNVSIQGGATQSSLINYNSANYNSGSMTFNHSQTPNDGGDHLQNLFYLYENTVLYSGIYEPEHTVYVIFDGIYDMDGNWTTTNDQMPVQYKTLAGDSTNRISRNTYYRLTATIRGLPGNELNSSFLVDSWAVSNVEDILGF